jgi:ubiquinone/menaquinone biosynthesis C-methylase UbiE
MINSVAAKGFNSSADAYERGRPNYPPESIKFLSESLKLSPGITVAEVGAGTGKFTRLLVPFRARVVAIEPVEGMRRKFVSLLPEVTLLAGTAEQLPLGTESVEAVVCAQSFNWFKGEKALQEFHRVLKPGGRLGLIWNARLESEAWVAELSKIIEQHESGVPRYKTGEWKAAFNSTALFSAPTYSAFSNVQTEAPEAYIDRVASISYIAAMPANEREKVLEKVRDLLRTHPQTKERESVEMPYRTDVFWFEKS